MTIYEETTYRIPQTVEGDVYARKMLKYYKTIGSGADREDSTNSIEIVIRKHYKVDTYELMKDYVEGGYTI